MSSHDELETLRALARDVAACDPVVVVGLQIWCVLCRMSARHLPNGGFEVVHGSSCPAVRAKTLTSGSPPR